MQKGKKDRGGDSCPAARGGEGVTCHQGGGMAKHISGASRERYREERGEK